MTAESDLRRATDDMRDARDALLAIVAPLSARDFAQKRSGGWPVARVLQHLIEAEAIYVKLMAHMTGGPARDCEMREPADAGDAAALLAETRSAILAAIEGVDADRLYALTKFGHEEFSPLSLAENIASHERDHGEQIATLVRGAVDGEPMEPLLMPPPVAPTQRITASDVGVRAATLDDLPRLTEIYNQYVEHTAITFDAEKMTPGERRPWFERYAPSGRHRLLVVENDGLVLGYTASSPFALKKAYETTVETTIICAPEAVGSGLGARLYTALFDALRDEDVHLAVALITVPNRGSTGLHERFGFTRAAVLREVGRKFDRYWDVAWYQKPLGRE